VRYVKTYAAGGARVRSFSGAAKAGVETNLSFKVEGTLSTLGLVIGDTIRQGQLIAEIDPADYEIQVERVEASLAQAKAQAATASADFERVRNLYERNNAPQSDYDAALGRSESAQANMRSVEKQLEQARLQVSYCKLQSPVAGTVAEVPVEVNENVRAGQPIVVLNAGVLPEVEVSIPETLIGEIRRGSAVHAVTFDAIRERVFGGVVTEVAVTPPQGLTTYPVTIQLQGADRRIFPGMAAEVSFSFGSNGQPSHHILPPQAVGEDREGRFVFVVKPGEAGRGVVERRSVAVGRLTRSERFGDGLEILTGLVEGEMVVTAGVSKITGGQQVSLLAEGNG
jgi:RND family efflux transporter MFP subunit